MTETNPEKTAPPPGHPDLGSGGARPEGWRGKAWALEDGINAAFLVIMAVLPMLAIVGRPFGIRIVGVIPYVSLLTLFVGLSGAMLAARDGKHLSLSTGANFLTGKPEFVARTLATFVAALATMALAYGAWVAVMAERLSTEVLPLGLPAWVPQLIMPLAYAVISIRLILQRFEDTKMRVVLFAVVGLGLLVFYNLGLDTAESLLWPAIAIVIVATIAGSPIYVALGAAALLLFWADGEPIAAVAAETVRQIKSPTMPTIPLFTFTGYILAEAGASKRLVRFFRAWFGWLPGGMAVMTALVCAFFTTFTGASGVTILALGGLLFPVLAKQRYPDGFNIGLLTASGSIGLLFPPSLPVILYGVIAHVPIDKMFVAGILPGFVLVGALALLGVRTAIKTGVERVPFNLQEGFASAKGAAWELLLPAIVMGGIFLGLTTLVEAAALTAVYALFIEVVIYKDLSIRKDLVRVGRDCATLIGGVLIILGVAMGFTSYLVDAEVPELALQWVQSGIESKYVFLIALNIFLLIVGCLMDIFSAIVVVVPLILPIGNHFGIDPIHLGIIFLANLELGFLTPPVGMNLFLSSYRFDRPLTKVYRYALPFLAILIIAVLLITYVPALTLAPVEWVFGETVKPPPIPF